MRRLPTESQILLRTNCTHLAISVVGLFLNAIGPSPTLFATIFALGFLIAPAALAVDLPRSLEDEMIYVVIVQKFFNGDETNDFMARRFASRRETLEGGFWGGDLAGVSEKLDYLAGLGVTALLLYPIVENDQWPMGRYLATGYRPRNYFRVDDNFGDFAALKSLVDEAHSRDLRVILDLPLGMPGLEYPDLQGLRQQDWLGAPTRYGLPQWNAEHSETADFLIKVAKYWRDETGCDGFRLDSAQFHSTEFWKRFVRELKSPERFANFILLAELPLPPSEIDQSMQQSGFDGAYDFSAGIVRDVMGREDRVERLSAVVRDARQRYQLPRSMMAQIDNYEDPEFITSALEPKLPRMAMAMTFLLTIDRVPLIYPGDEQAISCRNAGDLFTPDLTGSAFLARTKKLISLRKSKPALRHGSFEEVYATHPVYAYQRRLERDRILVVFNVSERAQPIRFAIDGKSWEECRLDDLLSNQTAKPCGDAGALQLNAFSSMVLDVSVADAATGTD